MEVAPRVVDLDAAAFIGREALRRIRDAGVARATVGLLGRDATPDRVEGAWPVTAGDTTVGATRWVTRSPRLGRLIAIGLVAVSHARAGTALVLETPAGPEPVEVTTIPFVPPPVGARDG